MIFSTETILNWNDCWPTQNTKSSELGPNGAVFWLNTRITTIKRQLWREGSSKWLNNNNNNMRFGRLGREIRGSRPPEGGRWCGRHEDTKTNQTQVRITGNRKLNNFVFCSFCLFASFSASFSCRCETTWSWYLFFVFLSRSHGFLKLIKLQRAESQL